MTRPGMWWLKLIRQKYYLHAHTQPLTSILWSAFWYLGQIQYIQIRYRWRCSEYNQRFVALPNDWLTLDNNQYLVDENADGSVEYSFGQPDFNFGQFRSNMVVRWEYIPGSTVFFVWTQEKMEPSIMGSRS